MLQREFTLAMAAFLAAVFILMTLGTLGLSDFAMVIILIGAFTSLFAVSVHLMGDVDDDDDDDEDVRTLRSSW
jgi:hypothetical protein